MNSHKPIANTIYRSRSAVRVSGNGKTETLVPLFSSTPAASDHASSAISPIPCLHIERSCHRAGARDLAYAIFRALDKQLPEAGYTKTFAQTPRATVEQMMNTAVRLLNMHRVGLLVIDECRNTLGPRHLRPSLPPSADVDASDDETRLPRAKRHSSNGDWEALLRQLCLQS